jgi:hypothetical protein
VSSIGTPFVGYIRKIGIKYNWKCSLKGIIRESRNGKSAQIASLRDSFTRSNSKLPA